MTKQGNVLLTLGLLLLLNVQKTRQIEPVTIQNTPTSIPSNRELKSWNVLSD